MQEVKNLNSPKVTSYKVLTSLTSFPCVHNKLVDLVGHSFLKTLAIDLDFAGVANFCLTNIDLEGGVGDMFAIAEDIDQMLTSLVWGECDAWRGRGWGWSWREGKRNICENLWLEIVSYPLIK